MIDQNHIDSQKGSTQSVVAIDLKDLEMAYRPMSPLWSSPELETVLNDSHGGLSSTGHEKHPLPLGQSLEHFQVTTPLSSPKMTSLSPTKRDRKNLRVHWDDSVVDNQERRELQREKLALRKRKNDRQDWIRDYRPNYRRPLSPGENREVSRKSNDELDDWIREYKPDYRRPPPPTEEDDFDPDDFSPVGSRAFPLIVANTSKLVERSIVRPVAISYAPKVADRRQTPSRDRLERTRRSQAANIGSKRTFSRAVSAPAMLFMKHPLPSSTVPPAVPDPPTQMSRPPPTPRISRLPTPELPEITGDNWCICSYCKRDRKDKMIVQLKAAEAHIKSKKQ